MKLLALLYLLLANICSLFAQIKPPVLMPGLGQHHHTISTKNPEAQRFFDQGLTLVFAFNHQCCGGTPTTSAPILDAVMPLLHRMEVHQAFNRSHS
jgi:hypothetical protein